MSKFFNSVTAFFTAFACLHGKKIHVDILGLRQITQLLLVVLVLVLVLSELSSVSELSE